MAVFQHIMFSTGSIVSDPLQISPRTEIDSVVVLPRNAGDEAVIQFVPRYGFMIAMAGLSLFIIGCWIYYAIRVRLRDRTTTKDVEKGTENPFGDNVAVVDPFTLGAQNLQAAKPSRTLAQPPSASIRRVRPRSLNSLFSGYRGFGSQAAPYLPLPEKPASARVTNRRGAGKGSRTSRLRDNIRSVGNTRALGGFASPIPSVPAIRINGATAFDFSEPPPSYRGSVVSGQAVIYRTPVPETAVIPPLRSNNPYIRLA